MTASLRRGIPVYLASMLLMAWIGSMHREVVQALERADADVVQMRADLTDLRASAADVRGPIAVATWAIERGMVPAPDVGRIEHVMPFPAPTRTPTPETRLEVTTTWR